MSIIRCVAANSISISKNMTNVWWYMHIRIKGLFGLSLNFFLGFQHIIPPREIKTLLLHSLPLREWYLNSSHDNAAHLTAWGLARQPGCRSHEASWGSHRGYQLDAPLGALAPKLRWCSRIGGCSRWCCGTAPHPDDIHYRSKTKKIRLQRAVLLRQRAAVRKTRVGGRSRPHRRQKHCFSTICSD